jgi:hypothetical protein
MDPIGLKAAVAALPAEIQPILATLLDRIDALEAQTAKDTKAIADEVIAALVPQAQALTQTVNAVANQAMTLIRRIDGASMTVKLGPEIPA